MRNKRSVLAGLAIATTLMGASCAMAGTCGSSAKVDKADKAQAHGGTYQLASATESKSAARPDIVDTAIGAGSFKTLTAALEAAGLVETLKGEGPFTVFAPTDDAFAKLPKGTVGALLKDKAALTKILTYHVVSGRVTAADVVKLTRATTVEGSAVKIKADKKGVRINDASVIQADIMTSNGVIHVIDTVLMPK